MGSPFSNDQWEDLLDFIEQGKVIPIIGEGAVTFGEDDVPLYPWLAERLAERLQVNRDLLGEFPNLNLVAQRHLLQGGERNQLYSRLNRILRESSLEPGPTLKNLAEIDTFKLFLTTTCDPLLEQALNLVRHGGEPLTQTGAFFPGASTKDTEHRFADLPITTIYHLLGKVSVAAGEFVAWEEDLLDFLFELPRHLGTDTMRNLSADLRSQGLLAVGLNFSDWIARLLLRIARQDSLSRISLHSWIAEGPPDSVAPSMVLFFGGVSKSIQVVECNPREFAAELARRWRERRPAPKVTAAGGSGGSVSYPTASNPGTGLVFLSYAREDDAAAKKIKTHLEAQGATVYFDRERLGGGMNFHYQLEDQVSHHCAVFVSLVSPHTETVVGENYFRRERFWASERAKSFSDFEREEFYLPFLVHESLPPGLVHEPRIFSGCNWNHCPGGEVAADIAKRVAALQSKFCTQLV